jgi:hypothetical protein
LTPKTQPKQQSSAQILSISLIRPIFVAFKWTIIEATAYKFIADLLQFVPPYLMKLLIEYYEGDHKPILEGVILILTMFIAALVQSLVGFLFYRISSISCPDKFYREEMDEK